MLYEKLKQLLSETQENSPFSLQSYLVFWCDPVCLERSCGNSNFEAG